MIEALFAACAILAVFLAGYVCGFASGYRSGQREKVLLQFRYDALKREVESRGFTICWPEQKS